MTYPDDDFDSLRIPPHSVDAEQSTLGGLMLSNQAWDLIGDKISEEDFYRKDHRLIFRSLRTLAEEGIEMDWITLSEWLKERGELENAGGPSYLGTMAKDTPSAANIVSYAGIVREHSISRKTIAAAIAIQESAYARNGKTAIEVAQGGADSISSIVTDNFTLAHNERTSKVMAKEVLTAMEERSDEPDDDGLLGLPTGIKDLDTVTNGYRKSDLIIVGARPAMGKSAFLLTVEQAAWEIDEPTFHSNMEMPRVQIAMRHMSRMSGVPLERIMDSKKMKDDDWARLAGNGVKKFAASPFWADDLTTQTMDHIRRTAERINEALLKEQNKTLGLATLDYIQLITGGKSGLNRNLEISEYSRACKTMAKDMDMPVIALAQLGRQLEQRSDKRPVMSDLRESGSLEQDADIVMFLYRDAVYDKEAIPEKGEIIIAKGRNIQTQTVHAKWQGNTVKWTDCEFEVDMGYGS